MKTISRDAIQRMTGSGSGGVSVGGGGGASIDLTGYATEMWTEENYVGKEFFSSLFKAYDANGNEVLPNDTDTVIDNIKAMFGFWTDFYVSALGTGGQSTVGLRLAQLADVNVAGVTNGQVLTYDSTTGKWIASTPQSGTDMATVWANLAANGNQQINASHLSTALTGYATQTWVGQQGYITASAISDMATKTWVNSQISDMATKTWAEQNYVNKEFFSSLFKAYDANGNEVLPNDTETTIDNIKAMFGFWTEFYVSALGTGGQSTVGLRLAQLADVNVAGVTNGQVLTYDSTTGKWIASTPQSGTDMATVWANLAANGNQQIDASHLSTALTGYATQTWVTNQGYITASAISDMATKTWVGQQGYITSSAISDMATKTWVGQQGYITSSAISDMATKTWVGQNYLGLHATADSATKLATARSLWGQSFDGTANVSGSLTDVGSIIPKGTADLGNNTKPFRYLYASWVGAPSNVDMQFGANNDNHAIIKTNGNCGIGIDTPTCLFDVNGVSKSNYMYFRNYNNDNNAGYVGRGSSSANTIYLVGYTGNAVGIGASNAGDDIFVDTNHNVGIGTTTINYKLHVNGTIGTANLYAAGYVTALSDARHKNVIGDTGLTVEQIAGAPAIRFTWKDRNDQSIFAGSIAQYWQKVLPEVVQSQADGTLSLDYQVAALISSITVACKVMNHESRLQRLEKMFAINEDDIED